MSELTKRIEKLEIKINLLSAVQQAITEHLVDDKDFFMKLMVNVMANKKLRNDFTEYIQTGDSPDDVKLFMQEVNEEIKNIKEKGNL